MGHRDAAQRALGEAVIPRRWRSRGDLPWAVRAVHRRSVAVDFIRRTINRGAAYARQTKFSVPVLLLGAAVIGVAVLLSGVVDISVSTGHLFFTRDLLPFARDRSVDFHAPDAPPDDEPLEARAMVQRGAAHYAASCQNCHGAPGQEPHLYSRSMLPTPPILADGSVIENRTVGELQWVVHNGLKYGGMPAWPVEEREDETWAMAAFLQALPNMSPEAYRRLAGLDRAAPEPAQVADVSADALGQCARCHGVDGTGFASGAFPNLSLLDENYMRASLHAYEDGTRHSAIMKRQLQNLSTDTLDALAAHYAGQPPVVRAAEEAARPELVTRGRAIAEHEGIADRGIEPCASCHGVLEETDVELDERVLYYPRIAGQYAPYIRYQMRAWVDDARGGVRLEDPRVDGAHQLEDDEIEAVAAYYGSLDQDYYSQR